MKRHAALLVGLLVLAAIGCASAKSRGEDSSADIIPPPAPLQVAASEARLAELQTSMTELLERIDVLNDRIARLESAAVEQPRAAMAPPSPAAPPTAARSVPSPRVAETPPPPAPPSSSASASKPLFGARVATMYRGALELYGKNRMADARTAFQQVFDADPTGDLADNALYWIGETYFAQANYREAMRYYTRVTKEYANENKAPDALFKMGVTYEKTSDLAMAKQAFDDCIKRYPYSSPAAAARLELKRIQY